jgi:hypothetical protein
MTAGTILDLVVGLWAGFMTVEAIRWRRAYRRLLRGGGPGSRMVEGVGNG